MKSFFIFCSGIPTAFLNRAPADTDKYVGIGATVFFTGVLAFCASSYALFTVFKSYPLAVIGGLVWACMIFNLDRYIVSSMYKSESSRSQWMMALPRIIFACLIAIVISKPIEMKLFDSEIKSEIVSMQEKKWKEQEDLIRDRYVSDEARIKSEILEIEDGLKEKEAYAIQLASEAVQEADGTGGSKIRNMGPIYKMKKAEADAAMVSYQEEQSRLAPLLENKVSQLESLQSERGESVDALDKVPLDGFAARLEALGNLTERNKHMAIASLFITLLFMALETAPIFVKLISHRGPLDYVQAKHLSYYSHNHALHATRLKQEKDYYVKTKSHLKSQWVAYENNLVTQAMDNELKRVPQTDITFDFIKKWKQKMSAIFSW